MPDYLAINQNCEFLYDRQYFTAGHFMYILVDSSATKLVDNI